MPSLNEGRGSNPGDTREYSRSPNAAMLPRSTKAGVRTPATRSSPNGPRRLPCRSTKAGVRTPATRDVASPTTSSYTSAQRRPGFEPRRHRPSIMMISCALPFAQRRPGFEPRRHLRSHSQTNGSLSFAQRRPGFEPRRHRKCSSAVLVSLTSAQRRPGFEPRRHALCLALNSGVCFAQRRPGFEPRRHPRQRQHGAQDMPRSTKAGVRTPATPSSSHQRLASPPSLNEGRGSNPGDTRPRWRRTLERHTSLNEGRGSNPGDTANPIRESLPRKIAQICGHQIPCSHAD